MLQFERTSIKHRWAPWIKNLTSRHVLSCLDHSRPKKREYIIGYSPHVFITPNFWVKHTQTISKQSTSDPLVSSPSPPLLARCEGHQQLVLGSRWRPNIHRNWSNSGWFLGDLDVLEPPTKRGETNCPKSGPLCVCVCVCCWLYLLSSGSWKSSLSQNLRILKPILDFNLKCESKM